MYSHQKVTSWIFEVQHKNYIFQFEPPQTSKQRTDGPSSITMWFEYQSKAPISLS